VTATYGAGSHDAADAAVSGSQVLFEVGHDLSEQLSVVYRSSVLPRFPDFYD
jgi:hypothetical protein